LAFNLFGEIEAQYFVFHQISHHCCCSQWNRS